MVQELQVSWLPHSINRIRRENTKRTDMGSILEDERCFPFQERSNLAQSKHLRSRLRVHSLIWMRSWIDKKLNNTLNSFATNCYRIMLSIKWIEVSNDIVYEKVGRDKLTLQVQQRQLRFVGHSL
jgi:hypothetical protein